MRTLQGSICETRKGPNRPLIRRGIDYLVYARVLDIQSFWTFWPNSAISGGRIWPKLSKATSTGQGLSFEPIPRSLRPSVAKKQPGKAQVPKNRYFGHFD